MKNIVEMNGKNEKVFKIKHKLNQCKNKTAKRESQEELKNIINILNKLDNKHLKNIRKIIEEYLNQIQAKEKSIIYFRNFN